MELSSRPSEERVSLRQWKSRGRLAAKQTAVRAHFVGLRIDGDRRERVVELHVSFGQRSAVAHRAELLAKPERFDRPFRERTPR